MLYRKFSYMNKFGEILSIKKCILKRKAFSQNLGRQPLAKVQVSQVSGLSRLSSCLGDSSAPTSRIPGSSAPLPSSHWARPFRNPLIDWMRGIAHAPECYVIG